MDTTDLYGTALLDFHQDRYTEDLQVWSSVVENDVLPLPYLFRSLAEMPQLEKLAINACKGHVLDVGAGAGCHSLPLVVGGHQVTALDRSPKACKVLEDRLKDTSAKIHQTDVWSHTGQYDSILMLMNGTGIFENLGKVSWCLEYLKKLLHPNGQVILDSSDLKFLFEDEEDGGLWVDPSKDYYGEVDFQLHYKQHTSPSFDWLYMDFDLLHTYASSAGFKVEKLYQGDHHQYLARLSLI